MKKIILLSLLIASSVYSQTGEVTEKSSSKIKVYTPSSSSSSAPSSVDAYKWTVKTDLFSFVSGEFPIIGEYRFAKKLSAEVSAGVTYGVYDNFGIIEGEDEYGGEGVLFESKAAMGSSFRVGVKYYPSSDYDAIEGWAFGLQFFTRTNNRDCVSDSYASNDYNLDGAQDSRNKTGLALTISKQVFSDSEISIEWLFGVGFAKTKHEFISGDYNSNATKSNAFEETVPNLQLGCRIGFGN